jgi:hypothetical protein
VFFELGERRASQGVTLSDFCWVIALIKERLWEFRARASNEARLKFRPDGIAASAAPVS